MGFSRQERWSGWPFPPPADLPDPGIKSTSALQEDSFFFLLNDVGRVFFCKAHTSRTSLLLDHCTDAVPATGRKLHDPSVHSHSVGLSSSAERSSQATVISMLLLHCFSRVRLCATPQTAAHQALLSLGFSRQEYWSGLPFPSPRKILYH